MRERQHGRDELEMSRGNECHSLGECVDEDKREL
jgi:hypothetical protein